MQPIKKDLWKSCKSTSCDEEGNDNFVNFVSDGWIVGNDKTTKAPNNVHASWMVAWQELMEVTTPKKLLRHVRIRLDDLLKFPSIFPKSERHFLLRRKKRQTKPIISFLLSCTLFHSFPFQSVICEFHCHSS
jgi:hypothetical protein